MLWFIAYFRKYSIIKFRQNINIIFKLIESFILSYFVYLLFSGANVSHKIFLIAFLCGFSSAFAVLLIQITIKHILIGINSIIIKKSKGKYDYIESIKMLFDIVL